MATIPASTAAVHVDATCADTDDDRVCWVCLGGEEAGSLEHVCGCPPTRVVHKACLAKWQLTSAGKSEEQYCRFCSQQLPDWRPTLTPQQLRPAASVMSVRYRGVTHRITYTPGPDGLEQFLATLNSIGIKVASASQVTFLCRAPDSGEEMALKGLKAFDAAAYCASITAAKRLQRDHNRRASADCGVQPEGSCDSPTTRQACMAAGSAPNASAAAPSSAAADTAAVQDNGGGTRGLPPVRVSRPSVSVERATASFSAPSSPTRSGSGTSSGVASGRERQRRSSWTSGVSSAAYGGGAGAGSSQQAHGSAGAGGMDGVRGHERLSSWGRPSRLQRMISCLPQLLHISRE